MSDCTFVSSRFGLVLKCFAWRQTAVVSVSQSPKTLELRPRLAQEKDRVRRALFFTLCFSHGSGAPEEKSSSGEVPWPRVSKKGVLRFSPDNAGA